MAIGVVAVTVAAASAGCGGSSSASAGGATQSAVQSTPQSTTQSTAPSKPRRVALTTPQRAVQSYLEGIQATNGAALCNVLDEGLQRALIQKLVSARPTEAGDSCAQALTELAAAVTHPGERRLRPRLQVTKTGDRAVVKYIEPVAHKPRTFVLVKHGPGWLIDKINGKG
ncbi:MAG: hypothetical protein ACRDLF_12710 [Solirubrobacteraceae bacterium]